MIIMDTCSIIWDALEPEKLTANAKKSIKLANEKKQLTICDISIWEISMLIKRKRLNVDETPSNFINLAIKSRNYKIQSITPAIAELSVNLDSTINSDPADRLIVATSIIFNSPIITADNNLRAASIVETIW